MMDRTREQEVWTRVMAAAAEAPAPAGGTAAVQPSRGGLTEAQLLELLAAEAADAGTYRAMAARAGNGMRRPLEQLAAEEQDHHRQLTAVYYLMTGRRPQTDPPRMPYTACSAETLRERYQAETADADRYQRLAETAGVYSETFRELGSAETRHAQRILKLLQSYL